MLKIDAKKYFNTRRDFFVGDYPKFWEGNQVETKLLKWSDLVSEVKNWTEPTLIWNNNWTDIYPGLALCSPKGSLLHKYFRNCQVSPRLGYKVDLEHPRELSR